ncbi:EthD domain-containing protein [Sphingobium subterraneum]|uniref:EthD domain-containing protein n=1 Tax=Sphingobium subterraneum TaxID=627688 RepID=A0A841IVL4_9SPHN|nr:EthD domain-containing protein [Sphingobium subterraneum]MBB6122300.1 hypothetical protein [Sphingobium subterraneum]
MPKVVALIKRKPGVSREQFRHHYETYHAPMAQRMVGHLLVKYVRNYPYNLVEYQPEDNFLDDGYDAITEFYFKDENGPSEMARIFSLPENNAEILVDEEKFQDRTKTRLFVVDEANTGVEYQGDCK